MGGAHSWHNSWYQNQLQATQRKMLRQEKPRSATQEANEIATDSLRRREEAQSPGTATAHANIQDYSFQTRQFRGRRKKGHGGPTAP